MTRPRTPLRVRLACAAWCVALLAACEGDARDAPAGDTALAEPSAREAAAPATGSRGDEARGDEPRDDATRDDAARAAARDDGPPGANWAVVDDMRAERDAPFHPSDGGGVLRFHGAPPQVRVGGRARFEFEFEVGEHGIVEGGRLEFFAPVSWGWSPTWSSERAPEPSDPPGRLVVSSDLEGVSLESLAQVDERVAMLVRGRALEPGETLRVIFGAGAQGARVDRFAERTPALHMRVDGDGDGVAALVSDPPRVDIAPGAAAQLVAHLPSSVAPGQSVRLTLAVLDGLGNAAPDFDGELRFPDAPPELGLPDAITLNSGDGARATVELTPTVGGLYRVFVQGPDNMLALSNPMLVVENAEPVRWADLHGHSVLSDGSGTPADYLAYARDIAGLDVVALTDHDHWGLPFLDERPDLVDQLREAVRAAHEPGRFVALFGFEWTSWIHGHRHVLGFAEPEQLPWLSSLDPDFEDPRQLWERLRGTPARTFAHHTSGQPVPTNWEIAPDPVLEPVVEVASVHGSSEAADGPRPVDGSRAGGFVRDALLRGYRYGFVGSGDSHDGHPGLAHLSAGTGGLAALLGAELTRESVQQALDARRTYATSGARILLRAALDGKRMGSALAAKAEASQLVVVVYGTAPLASVEVVRGAQVVERRDYAELRLDALETFELPPLSAGEFVYARVRQTDGHTAWCSPFFVE